MASTDLGGESRVDGDRGPDTGGQHASHSQDDRERLQFGPEHGCNDSFRKGGSRCRDRPCCRLAGREANRGPCCKVHRGLRDGGRSGLGADGGEQSGRQGQSPARQPRASRVRARTSRRRRVRSVQPRRRATSSCLRPSSSQSTTAARHASGRRRDLLVDDPGLLPECHLLRRSRPDRSRPVPVP